MERIKKKKWDKNFSQKSKGQDIFYNRLKRWAYRFKKNSENLSRINLRKTTPCYTTVILLRAKDKEEILKAVQEGGWEKSG